MTWHWSLKLLTLLACWLVWPVSGWSQGTISFGNLFPVYDVDGKTPLAGPGFLAELYAAAPGSSLQPIPASITPFLAAAPGYFFNPYDVAVPGVVDQAIAQVVAWRASDGPTFELADHLGAHVGVSPEFKIYGALPPSPGNTLPSATLNGMPSFALQVVVPEPTALALILFGGVSLSWWRCLGRRH